MWRDERLRDITHERLQDWITWLSTDSAARQHNKNGKEDAGLSPARVVQTHQVVSQVLSFALRSRYVATNAADHVELPRKTQRTNLALTHDQVRRLAEGMANAENAIRHHTDTRTAQTPPKALTTMASYLAYTACATGSAPRCVSATSTPTSAE